MYIIGHIFPQYPPTTGGGGDEADQVVEFHMSEATKDPPGLHTHTFEMATSEMVEMMQSGTSRTFDTSENNGHAHT